MHISENPEYETETAMLIEEALRQRIIGMKNEAGVYITPAFPKLLYVTDENNIHPDSPYYYLTELAAECVSKRMLPDFISAKKMREEHDGEVFPCMGCVEENEIITYKYCGKLYVESFIRMWNRLGLDFKIENQFSEENPNDNPNLFMNLSGVTIYDSGRNDFVITEKIIKNVNKNNWMKIELSGGRLVTCTEDHPFPTARGRVLAGDLKIDDIITINKGQYVEEGVIDSWDSDLAWAYGVLLHKANLSETVTVSLPRVGRLHTSLIAIINYHYDTYCDTKKIDDCQVITFKSEKLQQDLIALFEGVKRSDRHIPNEVFSMSRETRVEMLAGIIDASGRLCTDNNENKVTIKTANKEMALQIMALMQSLDMPASIKEKEMANFKTPKYKVSCIPSKELLESMICLNIKGSLTNFAFNNGLPSSSKPKTIKDGRVISIKNTYVESYSYDVETESDHFDVSGIYSHNCRSFLGLYKDENDKYKWYGRFNQGVCTLNLVDVGLSAEKDIEMFWAILEERLELCYQALMIRHERLKDTDVGVSPIHWKYGALARTEKDNFNDLLYGGYSSISLGYAGLYECVLSLIGESHTSENGQKLALEIMERLGKKCAIWKEKTNIGFALYGTPLESTTFKLAKCLKKRFGIIEGITDHDYVTNSYHVNVQEDISAEDKLKFESQFQSISSGGFISYIETCNLSGNIPAVIDIIKYMYENIKYAEMNGKFDYCQECGFSGEILLDEHNEWYCPNCGNTNHETMNVARRTCGYIGDNFWNDGRTEEIGDRIVHVDNKDLVI